MKVQILTINGKSLILDIDDSMTIEQLKTLYQDIQGLPVSEQTLLYENEKLEDWLSIRDYNMPSHTTIRLIPILSGGGFSMAANLTFNAMNQVESYSYCQTGPQWRQIFYGLSTRGKCKNNKCEAYNQYVYKTLGYGEFDLRNMIEKLAICPMCNKITECNNIVLSRATWYYKATLGNGKKVSTKKNPGFTQKNKYSTFRDGDNETFQCLRFYINEHSE
jgi:hypothetical protein